MKPRVSVVILAHGGSNKLKMTLDSVVAQTYDNIEIIIVDNGPKKDDATKNIAKSHGDGVSLYRTEGDTAAALKFGIKKLAGQYFSWLSAGDTYDSSRVAKLVSLIDGAKAVIAISDWVVVNRNGRKTQACVVDERLEEHPSCFLAFAREVQLNTCAMLIPVNMLKKSGVFDGSLPPSRDYRMLSRLISAGVSFKVVNQSLLSYGSHPVPESLADPTAVYSYDFVRSDVIKSLSHDDIVSYFAGEEGAVAHYKELLAAGLPRSASFLMEKIIKGSIAVDGSDAAKTILLNDLSGLAENQMATDADTLISKITKPVRKKKILFSSAHWLTGGMERVMTVLFRELQDDYEIFLITPYDARKSSIDVPVFVTSVKISDGLFVDHFDSLVLSYALLLDIDVIVGFINLFDKQLNLYNLCVGTKIKTIASNHEYYFYPYTSPTHYRVVEKRLSAYTKCDAVVWPNSFNAALCGMYTENNCVIGNPNNFEVVQKVSPSEDKVVVCVGRFNDYVKRIDRILQCFALVLEKVPDAKLVLVGKYDTDAPIGPNDGSTIGSLIEDLAIPSDRLDFVGEVSNVQDYYAKARVLILTSNSEGFGMVLNEAACFGVPPVCNYIPGIEDIVVNGENGYITAQGDLSSMAARVSGILSDGMLQRKLSDNARKKASVYDSRHIGGKWRYLIGTLLETNDQENLRKKLNSRLGYAIQDQQLFTKVLAKELNEIFYMSIQEGGQPLSGILLTISKFVGLPRRLKANIEHEGWFKTVGKVVTRASRIARNKLKI